MEGTIAAPIRHVTAMIWESDLGTLAGTLTRWEVLEAETSAPFRRRVFYISKLPWPFMDRAFHIRAGVERPAPNSVGIISASVSEPDLHDRAGSAVWGDVLFSGYHLKSLGSRTTWLRRIIGIELGLAMPRGMMRWSLIKVYRGNYRWMNQAAGSDLMRRLEERMARDPLYASLGNDPD